MPNVESEPLSPPRVAMLIPRAIVRGVGGWGPDAERVLSAGSLSWSDLDDADATMSVACEEAMWRAAVLLDGGALIGLRAARALGRGAFGALEYSVRNSATLTEGMQRLVRFARLLHGAQVFRFDPGARGGGVLSYRSPHVQDAPIAAVVGDFALAAVLLIGRDATGSALPVSEARLARAAPRSSADYVDVFGPDVRFGAADWSLSFSPETLAMPMRAADNELCEVLDRYLTRDLVALDASETFLARLRVQIKDLLGSGEPSIASVAAGLELGERTLQRRLRDIGTSFHDELNHVRRDLALRLLRQPDVTVTGVALLLGYGEVSSFHRAFRRWTGTTPGRFRRNDAK